MKKFNKQEISEMLQSGVKTVSFTKVNKEVRHMDCTLLAAYMPMPLPITENSEPAKLKRTKAPNEHTLSVWDVRAKGWRSFRIENVFEIQDTVDIYHG